MVKFAEREESALEKEYIEKYLRGFESERLIMRPFRDGDEGDIYDYAKDPDVGPHAGWKPHDNIDESRSVLKMFMDTEDELTFALVEKESGKVIGSLGLMKDFRRQGDGILEMGYVLGKNYWGRGLMTEAAKAAIKFSFEELGLGLLTIYHFDYNMRSKRVIEKCGFKFEGVLRSGSKIFDGRVYDSFCYSMTKEEYEKIYRS